MTSKEYDVGGGEDEMWSSCMQVKLICYQHIECYNYQIFYTIPLVTTKNIHVVVTQKKKRKE